MDEELERWARAWQAMEVKHVNIMKRAQAAHRFEAMWQGVLAAVVGLGVLLVAIGFELLAALGWHQVLLAVLALAFEGWALWRSWQQAALARARLVETPLGFVTDLMHLRERELFWWVDKRVLLAGGVLVLAANGFAIDNLARFRAAGEPRILSEALVGLALLILVASFIFGIRRVRYLRRDLASLRELRSELEPER
jgi:hypothetical protein